MSDEGGVEQTNVRVMVRCRPFNKRELATVDGDVEKLKSVIVMNDATVTVLDPDTNYQERDAFAFDRAFWSMPESQGQFTTNPFADQEMVFKETGLPAVENAMKGFHNTIFAYGQTGSGKTYSMLGAPGDEGIAPRLVRHLFAAIENEKSAHASERTQFKVELSFLEIYNERVKDLLAKAEAGKKKNDDDYADCKVRFHPEKGTFVEGLIRMEINEMDDCLNAIKDGMEHRAVTSTLMNATSSRSHAIFQILLMQKSPLRGTTRSSIINLVDLAGSERIKMSGVSGTALQEAKNINQSLSTLRRVIDVLIDNSKLKKGQRPSLPPYRESLLTWVLSDSLGGNSKTVMVAAVSPYSGNLEDSLGTLRYALKAKAIVCNARVNEEKTAAVVNQLRNEMDELRRQLEQKADADTAEQERLKEALQTRQEEVAKQEEEAARLDELKRNYEEEMERRKAEVESTAERIAQLEDVERQAKEKEDELVKARKQHEKTAQMLREQEEQRKRKDAELQAVLDRKESLRRHHDEAAVHEAKAKLEAEQARMRQFVSAFQNAFLLGKQKTGLDELKEERDQLKSRIATLESDITQVDEETNRTLNEKTVLQRQATMLDRKCNSMQQDLQNVMQGKNEKIAEMTSQKQSVESELNRVLTELSHRRDELDAVKQLYEKETEEVKHKTRLLEQEHQSNIAQIARRSEATRKLRASVKETEAKLDEIEAESAEYRQKITDIREENARRERTLADLEREKALQERQRDEVRQILAVKQKELEDTREELEKTTEEVERLRHNHGELRQYVSAKFFPTASKSNRAPAATPGNNGNGASAASAASGSTPRRGRYSHISASSTTSRARRSPSMERTSSSSQRRNRSPSPTVGSFGGGHQDPTSTVIQPAPTVSGGSTAARVIRNAPPPPPKLNLASPPKQVFERRGIRYVNPSGN